ncbi:MAG TPA: hypothetical protein VG711_06300 [Phycisphaerales bacterium]|nr:hypothetical protein [Phycisphaerales bacterium]
MKRKPTRRDWVIAGVVMLAAMYGPYGLVFALTGTWKVMFDEISLSHFLVPGGFIELVLDNRRLGSTVALLACLGMALFRNNSERSEARILIAAGASHCIVGIAMGRDVLISFLTDTVNKCHRENSPACAEGSFKRRLDSVARPSQARKK